MNNLIYNLRDNRRGISLYNDGLTDGKNGEISNAIINYNNITCIDSTNNFGIRLAGYVTSTQITNNLVSKCNQSFIGINSRNGNHYPLAPFIHFNSFENESFIWNGARLNANYNFFGNCVDPIQLISGNVTFNPYYGSCIQNTSISKSCLMSYDTVRLFSQISSKLGVCNVKFYIYSSNSINPLIYDGISNLGNYTYDLNLDAYDGQNITWNVSSDDCNGFFNMIRGGSFKVNKRTSLSTNPANPDGLNSWYGSRPIFYLINPEASSLFYRWEAGQTYLYNVPFSLDNSPNDGNNSGGIMRLNYWSNICNESVQNKTFYIDLTAPIVNRLIPDNNQIVYNNKRPVISAYLEEVYFSNSGIDKSSVRMFVNGIEVNRTISTVDVQNAIITHNPSANLNEGRNNISVFVRDNSGKSTNFSWSFFINTSVPMFNMSINSPNNQVYSTRSVKFNIILTSEVEKLEYINFNDNVPRYKSLCLRCNGIGYLKNFNIALNEGDNNISIRAIDRFGNIVQKEISLFIDSKPPIVNLVAPRRNQHTNGSLFFIKYTEDNLMNITFYYGNGILIENITKDCSSGKKQECIFNAELESFNGERIIYWFNITDIARTISTKPVEVFADTNAPQINIVAPKENLTYYSLSKARMALNITLDEKADLAYINYEDIIPKLKKLCSNCNKYYGTQTFNLGVNNITVFARDSAGNSLSKSVSFSIN